MTTTAPDPDPLEALKAASVTAEEASRGMASWASAVSVAAISLRKLREAWDAAPSSLETRENQA